MWEGKYIYGQYKTARSVAEKLRKEGKKVRIVSDQHLNYIVQVWKKTKDDLLK